MYVEMLFATDINTRQVARVMQYSQQVLAFRRAGRRAKRGNSYKVSDIYRESNLSPVGFSIDCHNRGRQFAELVSQMRRAFDTVHSVWQSVGETKVSLSLTRNLLPPLNGSVGNFLFRRSGAPRIPKLLGCLYVFRSVFCS